MAAGFSDARSFLQAGCGHRVDDAALIDDKHHRRNQQHQHADRLSGALADYAADTI